MACGLPVVALDIEWAKEIVINGKTGILVDCPMKIPEGVKKAIRNKNLGENARKEIENRFSLDVWRKRELQIYNKVSTA